MCASHQKLKYQESTTPSTSGLPGEEAIAIDCFLVLPEGKGTPVVTRILEEMGGACTWISVTVFACLGAPANQVLRDYLLCDS